MQIIKQQEILGQDFKVYGDFENPLFLAKDVAIWIEHTHISRMLASVDDDEKLTVPIVHSGQNREMWFLTEDGLYEVLMQSRKPIAKEFKKQVKVVLKEIRTTGSYVNPNISPQLQYLITLEQTVNRQALEIAEINKKLDSLKLVSVNSKNSNYNQNFAKKKTNEQRRVERNEFYRLAFDEISVNGSISSRALAKYIGVCERTIRNRIATHNDFVVRNGIVYDVTLNVYRVEV